MKINQSIEDCDIEDDNASVLQKFNNFQSVHKSSTNLNGSGLKISGQNKFNKQEISHQQNMTMLQNKMNFLQKDLDMKEKENQELKEQLIRFEIQNNINVNRKKSTILEKDKIRNDLKNLSKQLLTKEEELRNLDSHYEAIKEENEKLEKELNTLQKEEPNLDKQIEIYRQKIKEYKELKLKLEENELVKNEQIFYTQMRLEENSKVQIQKELEFIKKEIESNDELAIFYLKSYLQKLKEAKI